MCFSCDLLPKSCEGRCVRHQVGCGKFGHRPAPQSKVRNKLLANAKRQTPNAKTTAESVSSIESSSLKTWTDHNVSDCDIRQTFTSVTATVKECDQLVDLAISVGLGKSVLVLSEHVEPFLLHAYELLVHAGAITAPAATRDNHTSKVPLPFTRIGFSERQIQMFYRFASSASADPLASEQGRRARSNGHSFDGVGGPLR